MKITADVYSRMLSSLPCEYESGGIIGGNDGVVTNVVFDTRRSSQSVCSYIPDVGMLNACIEDWQNRGISFLGLFHSHFGGLTELSSADKLYASEILRAVNSSISSLYFPIVIPKKKVFVFVGKINGQRVEFIEDTVEIE